MLSVKNRYEKQFVGDWHIGESLPFIAGRVVEFKADGDELEMILDAMRKTRLDVILNEDKAGKAVEELESLPRNPEQIPQEEIDKQFNEIMKRILERSSYLDGEGWIKTKLGFLKSADQSVPDVSLDRITDQRISPDKQFDAEIDYHVAVARELRERIREKLAGLPDSIESHSVESVPEPEFNCDGCGDPITDGYGSVGGNIVPYVSPKYYHVGCVNKHFTLPTDDGPEVGICENLYRKFISRSWAVTLLKAFNAERRKP